MQDEGMTESLLGPMGPRTSRRRSSVKEAVVRLFSRSASELPGVEQYLEEGMPGWACDKEAKVHLTKCATNRDEIPHSVIEQCLGPSVPHLRNVAMFEVLSAFVFFAMTCSEEALGFSPLLKYLVVAPWVWYRHHTEQRALQHLIPPYVDDSLRAGAWPWVPLGLKTGFKVWWSITTMFSVLKTLDFLTDTRFAAVTSYSIEETVQGERVKDMWAVWWQAWCGTALPPLPIAKLVVFMWLLTLIQVIEPVVFTWPINPVNYKIGDGGLVHYPFDRLNFEGVFFFLSEAMNFGTVQALAFRQAANELHCIPGEVVPAYAISMVNQMMKRNIFNYLFVTTFQLNLQAVLWAIDKSIRPHSARIESGISLSLSVCMAVLKLKDVYAFETYRKEVYLRMASDEAMEAYIKEHPQEAFFLTIKHNLWKRFWAIRFVGVVMLISLLHALLILYMGIKCNDAVRWSLIGGCAQ